jgi:hypothetical protein
MIGQIEYKTKIGVMKTKTGIHLRQVHSELKDVKAKCYQRVLLVVGTHYFPIKILCKKYTYMYFKFDTFHFYLTCWFGHYKIYSEKSKINSDLNDIL